MELKSSSDRTRCAEPHRQRWGTTWENARNGVSGAAPITRFDASKFKTQFACEVRITIRLTTSTVVRCVSSTSTQCSHYGCRRGHCRRRARRRGYRQEPGRSHFAAGIGGLHTFEEEAGYFAVHGEEQGPKYNPFFIPKMIADIAAGHISIAHEFRGPNYATVSACASSNNALIDAS